VQVFAVESNPVYQRTFLKAHPGVKLYREPVSSFLAAVKGGKAGYPKAGSIDVLVGGSPCQPYSLLNTGGDFATDTRKELV
jgi:site-specific DNA-cytosine methylase